MTRSRFLHDLGAELISHGNELLKRSRDLVTKSHDPPSNVLKPFMPYAYRRTRKPGRMKYSPEILKRLPQPRSYWIVLPGPEKHLKPNALSPKLFMHLNPKVKA